MSANTIIERNIEMFSKSFTKKDKISFQAKHTILGMIQMSVHLGALSFTEAEIYIDSVFAIYSTFVK